MGAIISAKEICYYSQSGRQIINSLSFAFGNETVSGKARFSIFWQDGLFQTKAHASVTDR